MRITTVDEIDNGEVLMYYSYKLHILMRMYIYFFVYIERELKELNLDLTYASQP